MDQGCHPTSRAFPYFGFVRPSWLVVDGPVVHLGDLFDGLGANGATPVARSPPPGTRVTVSARWQFLRDQVAQVRLTPAAIAEAGIDRVPQRADQADPRRPRKDLPLRVPPCPAADRQDGLEVGV